jgi:hypothetical protein
MGTAARPLRAPPRISARPLARLLACLLAGFCLREPEARTVAAATAEDLKTKTGPLAAGDTLLVAAGNYDLSTWDISDLAGTEKDWIVIRSAAQGKAVIRSTSGCCNLVQMSDLAYVRFEGFEITMKDLNDGIDGINMTGKFSHHVVMDRLLIQGVTNNGISLFPDSAAFITLSNSEVRNTSGSGLYWGYPNRNTLHDILIQGNYIHHCPVNPAEETNYGIQFKGWGYRSRFLDNVLHDVGGTTRSGLIVYYGKKPLAGDVPADRNIVAGNVLWNCRNEGITVMSDAIIENNIVMDAETGINIQTYGDESFTGTSAVENLSIRNNTVFRCRSANFYISGWGNAAAGVSFTGNASYQDQASKTAFGGSLGKGTAAGNVAFGISSLAGTKAGRGLQDFVKAAADGKPGALDFYPSDDSPLLEAVADKGSLPATDFNGISRPQGAAGDAGAYERGAAANPGWALQAGFKTGSQGSPVRRVDAPKAGPRPSKGSKTGPGARGRAASPLFSSGESFRPGTGTHEWDLPDDAGPLRDANGRKAIPDAGP